MIIGASPESDLSILRLTEGLYNKYKLKRVFFSAYVPVTDHSDLPALGTKPPLLRENRLYQADWLMRVYGFKSSEILDEKNDTFNPYLDPKCNWAVNHPEFFPVEINKAPYESLLRVPGIGVTGARKLIRARRAAKLDFPDLKKLGIVLKRAQYFILCSGKAIGTLKTDSSAILNALLSRSAIERLSDTTYARQISMFDSEVSPEEVKKCITGEM
jgi:predicted DNA-binding helix-hairpin-helix protein